MARRIGETWSHDGPEATCFGCGHANDRGLRLVFTRTGQRTVEARFRAEPHWCGSPAVVHGGIQAALLDEVMGMAGHLAFDDEPEGTAEIVTADFRLRYRRPVPVAAPLLLLGELRRVEGRDVFVEGEIRDEAGELLTRGEARWRRLSS